MIKEWLLTRLLGKKVIFYKSDDDDYHLINDICIDGNEVICSYNKPEMENKKMIKVMISQPMNGKTSKQINDEREQIAEMLLKCYPDTDIEVMNTTVANHETKSDLECFSESIGFMAEADVLVMAPDWEKARGCKLEHDIAVAYNVPRLYITSTEVSRVFNRES